MEIKFSNIGKSLGTRDLGKSTRINILEQWNVGDKIIFDFEGVRVVTNSFADECFAKILDNKPFDEIQQKTTFVNTNDVVLSSIITAFKRRLNK